MQTFAFALSSSQNFRWISVVVSTSNTFSSLARFGTNGKNGATAAERAVEEEGTVGGCVSTGCQATLDARGLSPVLKLAIQTWDEFYAFGVRFQNLLIFYAETISILIFIF